MTSMLIVIMLFLIFLNVQSKNIKYPLFILTILIFPIIYFSFFNSYDFDESSRKMIKEGFNVSNVEYLDKNAVIDDEDDDVKYL